MADLCDIPHRRELPAGLVVREYAALWFLSPEGFRHFIRAYMLWVLRNPGSPEAVVTPTARGLSPEIHREAIRDYARWKCDTETALAFWRGCSPSR